MTANVFNMICTLWQPITKVGILLIIGILFLRKTDYEMHIIDRLKYIGIWVVLLILIYETSGVLFLLFRRLYSLGII